MADIIVSLTNTGRQMEAQGLLFGYGYRIDYFAVGSGGHDPGNSTIALPLNLDVTSLPGQFFGPQPINQSQLISPTCPQWTCILQPGEAVGQISDFGLIATVVFIPQASLLLTPDQIFAGTSNQNFTPFSVDVGTSTLNVTNHGFTNGQQVVFSTTNTLPTGLDGIAQYYVINATTNTFQVSLTNGGSAITITTQGIGTHTVRLASDDTFTYFNHGLTNGTPINPLSNGTMPAGLIANQTYYVAYATPNTFKLSTSSGGGPVDILDSGSGVLTITNLASVPPGAPSVGSTFLFAIANFPARFKLSSVRETFNVTLQT